MCQLEVENKKVLLGFVLLNICGMTIQGKNKERENKNGKENNIKNHSQCILKEWSSFNI